MNEGKGLKLPTEIVKATTGDPKILVLFGKPKSGNVCILR